MLFAVTGRFRPDTETAHEKAHEAFGDHIAQPVPRIRLGGALRDDSGRRVGLILLIEAEDLGQIQRFIAASPYSKAELYERIDVDNLDLEIGSLG